MAAKSLLRCSTMPHKSVLRRTMSIFSRVQQTSVKALVSVRMHKCFNDIVLAATAEYHSAAPHIIGSVGQSQYRWQYGDQLANKQSTYHTLDHDRDKKVENYLAIYRHMSQRMSHRYTINIENPYPPNVQRKEPISNRMNSTGWHGSTTEVITAIKGGPN